MSGALNEVVQGRGGGLQESHMFRSSTDRAHGVRIDCARLVVLLFVAVGCTTAGASRVEINPPARPIVTNGYDRLLVAGFIDGAVSDRRRDIDVNVETARFLRMALRSKSSLRVVENDPLRLEPASTPRGPRSDARLTSESAGTATTQEVDNPVFRDVAFWKRVGEEYGEPLILTGTVTFTPVAPQLSAGPRTIRLWRPGFRLAGTMVVISGRTGEILDSLTLWSLTAHATTGRESALSLYFRLMDRAMPSILTLLGQQRTHDRVLLR